MLTSQVMSGSRHHGRRYMGVPEHEMLEGAGQSSNDEGTRAKSRMCVVEFVTLGKDHRLNPIITKDLLISC